ncbi:hypothetical protein FRC02_002672 [Tulasnella sp. 418]|nr:hypothetical protein FRC02_002672 [Tulasnella sp. 418]
MGCTSFLGIADLIAEGREVATPSTARRGYAQHTPDHSQSMTPLPSPIHSVRTFSSSCETLRPNQEALIRMVKAYKTHR